MKKFAIKYFINDLNTFQKFFKLFYPIILASGLFAFNGFIDNFMVGSINQGAAALTAVNSWTNIITGIFIAVSTAGSIIMTKYYFSKKFELARDIYKMRILISFFFALFFALCIWINADFFIELFLKKPNINSSQIFDSHTLALKNAKNYAKIIAIQWILMAITYNLGIPLSEIGHSKISMIWGFGTLFTNIFFNTIFIFIFKFGVIGVAWASIAGRMVALITGISYMKIKKIELRFNLFTIFKINSKAFFAFLKNWFLFLSSASIMFFMSFRYYFYDLGYELGKDDLGKGVGAVTILALSGAIMNIFVTTANALGPMSINFVGSELYIGNTEKARINANKLKGFVTLFSILLSFILILISLFIPKMIFLSKEQKDQSIIVFDNIKHLEQVKNTLLVVAFFYPIWTWTFACYKISLVTNSKFKFIIFRLFFIGPFQMFWAFIVFEKIVPSFNFVMINFWLGYFIFLSSDILHMIINEIFFSRLIWHEVKTLNKNKKKNINKNLI